MTVGGRTLSFAFLASVLLASSLPQPATARAVPSFVMASLAERCAAALELVRQQIPAPHRPLIFDPESDFSVDRAADRRQWGNPDPRKDALVPPPARALLLRLQRDGATNALHACPSIRAYLTRRGVRYGKAAVAAAIKPGAVDYAGTITAVSLPIIAKGGTEAVLVSTQQSGLMAFGEMLNHMRRSRGGHWRLVGLTTYAVS